MSTLSADVIVTFNAIVAYHFQVAATYRAFSEKILLFAKVVP